MAFIVIAAVPFGAPESIVVESVRVQFNSPPATLRLVQVTPLTPVEAETLVALMPAGNWSSTVTLVPVYPVPPELPMPIV